MSAKNSLLKTVLKAAIITESLLFLLVISSINIVTNREYEEISGVFSLIISVGAATWWIFRKHQKHAPRREARTVATAFAVSAPISLIIAIPGAEILGRISAYLGGPFGFIGTVLAVLALSTLICFAGCSLALWIARRRENGDFV